MSMEQHETAADCTVVAQAAKPVAWRMRLVDSRRQETVYGEWICTASEESVKAAMVFRNGPLRDPDTDWEVEALYVHPQPQSRDAQ